MSTTEGFGGVQLAYNLADLNELQLSKLTWPQVVEPKLDGIRCLITKGYDNVLTAMSRAGKTATSINHILDSLSQLMLPGQSLDGEIMGPHDFNTTSGRFRQKFEVARELRFHVFDMPSLGHTIYEARRYGLESFFSLLNVGYCDLIYPEQVKDLGEVYDWYDRYLNQGYEGLILKDPRAVYFTRRNKSWLKLKDRLTCEAVIIGAFEGTGKYTGMLGGFNCEMFGNKHEGMTFNLGTGFADVQRKEYWDTWTADQDQLLGAVVEISYHELTGRGSIRHPSFHRFRPEGL